MRASSAVRTAIRRIRLAAAAVCVLALASACADDGRDAASAAPSTTTTAAPATNTDDKEAGALQNTIEIETDDRITAAAAADAESLRVGVTESVARNGWASRSDAEASGFRPMFGDEAHWVHPDHVTDGASFDVERPEFLVIDDAGDVIGVMFLASSPDLDQDPPPGSPLLKWHYHQWERELCLEAGLVVAALPVDGVCAEGSTAATTSPLMAHVWLSTVDPFATAMDAHQH